MSRLNIFLILILAALLFFAPSDSAMEEKVAEYSEPAPTLTSTPTPTPTISLPSSLSIPKIGVIAPIVPVGVDEMGKMQLPQNINEVGWYSLGYKPGESGNAVISGHLDSTTGEGAIFYHLHELEVQDDIIIIDETGQEKIFKVVEKATYPYNQVPIDTIFGESTNKRLNLITCTGVWNGLQRNYSHRMIITAELME